MPERKTKAQRPPWELVLREMVSVDITISYWRGKAKLDWRSDIGLTNSTINAEATQYKQYYDAMDEVVLGGQRRLLPPEMHKRLEKIERAARAQLEALSFQTGTMFGNLMPKKNYELFIKRLTVDNYDQAHPEYGSLEKDFYYMRDRIVEERENILTYIRESHYNLAVGAWRLQEGLPIDADDVPPGAWINEYLARVTAALPDTQKIYDSFNFEYMVADIPVPDEAVKQVKLEELEREQRRLDAELAALEVSRKRLYDRVEQQALLEVERAKHEAEAEEIAARYAAAKQERERVERDLKIQREISSQAVARIQKSIDPALDEITTRVRGMLYKQTLDALAAVKRQEKMPPQTLGALKKLIATSRELNWTDDGQINEYLEKLQSIADNGAGSGTGAAASTALNQLVDALSQDLTELENVKVRQRRMVIEVDASEVSDGQRRMRTTITQEELLPDTETEPVSRMARRVVAES